MSQRNPTLKEWWEAIGTAIFTESGQEIVYSPYLARSLPQDHRKQLAYSISKLPELVEAAKRVCQIWFHSDDIPPEVVNLEKLLKQVERGEA